MALLKMGDSQLFKLSDILANDEYERIRSVFRSKVIEHKRLRRIALGPIMTLVFESVNTVRFQIQEMMRAEQICDPKGIQAELDAYNPLIPQKGELSATLLIELVGEEELQYWLPRLVGIESSINFELQYFDADSTRTLLVPSKPEATHLSFLSRDSATSAVHYLRFAFDDHAIDLATNCLATGIVALDARHRSYEARTVIDHATGIELLGDLRGETKQIQLS